MNIGRLLMLAGVGLFLLGGLVYLLSRFGLPLGRLPGDIRIEGEQFTCFIPLATGILLSILLSLAINLINRFWQ